MSDPIAVREKIDRLFSNLRYAIANDHSATATLSLRQIERQWQTTIPGNAYAAFLDRERALADECDRDVSLASIIAELIAAVEDE